jgi:putative chitinase
MSIITAAQLRALAPDAAPWIIDGIVENQQLLVDAEITKALRLRHFFAQSAAETGGFERLEESLIYSAKRLMQVWPNRFPTMSSAVPYAGNPGKLAEKVYGGRMGNRRIGDGWKYRGSGLLQSTGRDRYVELQAETGLDVVDHPELLRTFPGALQSACLYWAKRGVNALADRNDIEAVTRAINGGLIGLPDRKVWFARTKRVWGADAAVLAGGMPGAVSSVSTTALPVLEVDDHGDGVRQLQQMLRAKGASIEADGNFGPKTEAAVRAFQEHRGLNPDGIVGPKTWAALGV